MHTIEEKDNSIKGKIISFFSIENDPLVRMFKKKENPENLQNI